MKKRTNFGSSDEIIYSNDTYSNIEDPNAVDPAIQFEVREILKVGLKALSHKHRKILQYTANNEDMEAFALMNDMNPEAVDFHTMFARYLFKKEVVEVYGYNGLSSIQRV